MANPVLQQVAAQVIRDTIDGGRSLDDALASGSGRLDHAQKPTLQEIAYGGCRYYFYLDGVLGELLAKPIRAKDRLVHFLLLVGLYQLEFMRTPDHAAVNQTVKALATGKLQWARGLVNGVLREFIRCKDDVGDREIRLNPSQIVSFSPFLYDRIVDTWPAQAENIFTSSIQRPPMTLRVNDKKTSRNDYLKSLRDIGIVAEQTDDSALGITLQQPRGVEDLPMFDKGLVSVQDESAQLCAPAMLLSKAQRVLDGCAAPGGKTCAILEFEPDVLLTSIDLPDRVDGIRQNLDRIGLSAEVHDGGLENYKSWWQGQSFHRVLLDVPCSGTGVIRRHPDILHHRKPGDFKGFAAKQAELLEIAWSMLAAEGRLLYVTCSIMPLENDDVIAGFLSTNAQAQVEEISDLPGIKTRYGIQRLPGIHQGDGFYYCRLAKL